MSRIGELLVREKMLSLQQLQQAQDEAKRTGKRLGATLARLGYVDDQRLTAFVATDDQEARQRVLELARQIGFDAVDAGPLKNARFLEPLAALNIQLGYGLKLGTLIGFALLRD